MANANQDQVAENTQTRAGRRNPREKDNDDLQLRDRIAEAIQGASEQSRWLTSVEIAELIGSTSDKVRKAITSKPLNQDFSLVAKTSKTASSQLNEELSKSPIYASSDVDRLAASEQLLEFVSRVVELKRRAKESSLQSTPKSFAADGIGKGPLRTAFENAVTSLIQSGGHTRYEHLLKSPPPPTPKVVAARMIEVLRDEAKTKQSYPISTSNLLKLANVCASSLDLAKVFKSKTFTSQALIVNAANGMQGDAICVLVDDLPQYIGGFLASALDRSTISAQSQPTTIFSVKELVVILSKYKTSQQTITNTIATAAVRNVLPAHIGWLRIKGERQFFNKTAIESADGTNSSVSRTDTQATAASTTPNSLTKFETAFDAAFNRVNERRGKSNFVRIDELRRELPQFKREHFDAGLLELERSDRVTLEPAHGGAVKLSDADRAEGILRNHSLLFYVKRI